MALPRTAAALVLRCRVGLSSGSEQENVCLAPIADTDGQKFWFRELCLSLSPVIVREECQHDIADITALPGYKLPNYYIVTEGGHVDN